MSDLTNFEKLRLERALGMSSGYVLGFSNRTFRDFFLDAVGIDIYDDKYDRGSGSKANRMRAFWDTEGKDVVGDLLGALFDNWDLYGADGSEPPANCTAIAAWL
ncbi:MAG: hypothetical protein IBX63_10645 [Coriobacteriia bacterium]|nr:hypothetical protein [Coriobacteriia bacterium]